MRLPRPRRALRESFLASLRHLTSCRWRNFPGVCASTGKFTIHGRRPPFGLANVWYCLVQKRRFRVNLASLMPPTPAQIKDKLTNALDDEKNVIDEKAVEEVIALLEASVITKEILEQTRLGRDINLVRKNSKNPAIAKRAKNLVKSWQKLIEDPGSPRVNGQHPHLRVSPGLSPAPVRNLAAKACLQSPALLQAKQLQASRLAGTLSPATSASAKLSQARPTPKAGKLKHSGKIASPALKGQPQNEDSNMSWAASSPSNLSESSQDRLLGDRENQEAKGSKNCQPGTSKRNFKFDTKPLDHSTGVTLKLENRASDQRDVSKTNVANRKRTRSSVLEEPNDSLSSEMPPSKQKRLVSPSQSLSASHKNNVINGSFVRKAGAASKAAGAGDGLTPDSAVVSSNISSVAKSSHSHDQVDSPLSQRLQLQALRQDSVDSRASSKAGKVKTTEQLIEDMQKKAASAGDMNVIAQIRTNLQQKEADAQRAAAAPTTNDRGGKKRGRKKKGANANQQLELPGSDAASDTRKLAQAKSEYIERFLQTSVTPTPGEDAFEHTRQESLEEPHHPIPLGGCSNSFAQSAFDTGFPAYPSRQDKPDSGPSASPPDARDILEGPTGPLRDNSIGSLENMTDRQLLARLPPIDLESIDWTLHDYPAPEPKVATAERVEELHHTSLPSVNGTYDREAVFRRWHEMLTVDSIYDEPLHILPYVLPND
ncbi:mediator of RNA polymerase II transcription subunit 26-like [Elysia marginata]|uniref:Mediator of RNA polymerase II transcription subunit 26 n=1 Tax=Elysia marginata TaxID=1093978 RepID=A0AAV4HK34_9GAST|nr:mediator of RNA polymerase II transcription subunit 26-like [Elysia marginata]